MLDIADKPDRISKAIMRAYFEKMVNDTQALKANTPLGTVRSNGEFSHYANPETDTMWLGFALGMRCAERVACFFSQDTHECACGNPDCNGKLYRPAYSREVFECPLLTSAQSSENTARTAL